MKHRKTARQMMTRIAVTGALSCGLAGAGISALVASAGPAFAAGTVRYVGASVGSDTSCSSPGYTTVQAAVNAASPGDTVYLCGTTPFAEQVIVNKSITLTGAAGATIAAPTPWVSSADALPPQFSADSLFVPQAIVMAWGSGVNATIRGLSITGVMPGNGGCAEEEYGILVIDGAHARIAHDAVSNIRDVNSALYGCQFGIGIDVGRDQWPTSNFGTFTEANFTGTATIVGTTVSGYQKGGVVIDNAGSSASVTDSTVSGDGPSGPLGKAIAQNGIEVARGASAQIEHNTVSGNAYSGGGNASDGGVLIFGGCGDPLVKNVVVSGNNLVNNDVGVYLANYNHACAAVTTLRTNDLVTKNQISDAAVTNTSGFSTGPLCGYQAGVSDLGKRDAITRNDIDGVGYYNHATCTVGQPYVTFRIDTTGSTDPYVHGNF